MAHQSPSEFALGRAQALKLLDAHFDAYTRLSGLARETGHTTPVDTKSVSQMLVTLLTGIRGLDRRKGADLEDGSDVKAANAWEGISDPRFNGCLPHRGTSPKSLVTEGVHLLDTMPSLFFVLWDTNPTNGLPRCQVWLAHPDRDPLFRTMAARWYDARALNPDSPANFQLHPLYNREGNSLNNGHGRLEYPRLFSATRGEAGWTVESFEPETLKTGACLPAVEPPRWVRPKAAAVAPGAGRVR